MFNRTTSAFPRAEGDADLVVLCGLVGHPEIERARAAELPMLLFDGVQGGDLGELSIALPFAPLGDLPFDHMVYGAEQARRGAQLVIETGGDSPTACTSASRSRRRLRVRQRVLSEGAAG